MIGERMSAIGTKRTWPSAVHMSAFGGKADMPFCTANVRYDPKRTLAGLEPHPLSEYYRGLIRCRVLSLGGGNEAARVHHASWQHSARVAACSACTASNSAESLEPASSAVPNAADKQHYNDNE